MVGKVQADRGGTVGGWYADALSNAEQKDLCGFGAAFPPPSIACVPDSDMTSVRAITDPPAPSHV